MRGDEASEGDVPSGWHTDWAEPTVEERAGDTYARLEAKLATARGEDERYTRERNARYREENAAHARYLAEHPDYAARVAKEAEGHTSIDQSLLDDLFGGGD